MRALTFQWLKRPWLDVAGAVLALAVHAVGSRWLPHLDVLGLVPEGQRGELYIAASTFVALVNAFSLTAQASYQGNRIREVLTSDRDKMLMRSWLLSIVGSLSVAGLMVVAGILAYAGLFPLLRWFVLAGLWFVVITGIRLMYAFASLAMVPIEDGRGRL